MTYPPYDSYDIPESQLEFEKAKLKQNGYVESKGVLPILKRGEFYIRPRILEQGFVEQMVSPQGEKIWTVVVEKK